MNERLNQPLNPQPVPSATPYAKSGPQGAAAALSPSQERTWGMLVHGVPGIAFVLSAGTLGFVASIVIHVLYKDRGPFVRMHTANSLNVQLTFVVLMAVALPLMLVLVGFVIAAFAYALVLFVHGVGAVKAWNGEPYRPRFTIPFVR